MTSQQVVELQDQQLKGVTLKLLYAVIGSTVFITTAVLTTLFAIKSELQDDRNSAKIRQTEVNGKFERIELTIDQNKKENEFRWTMHTEKK